jgi:hypothetical protein
MGFNMVKGTIYWNSLTRHGNSTLFVAKDGGVKSLYVCGAGEAFDKFEGDVVPLPGGLVKRCPLSNANAKTVLALFPFTRPVNHKGRPLTIGLGDRLGLASAGHIRAVRALGVFPVLAQQSIRELNLTGRTYDDVISAAVWAVFREGYRDGWGADGDHLKTYEEVAMALGCGVTMITLDCSEHIRNDIAVMPEAEAEILYDELDIDEKTRLESTYAGKVFPLDGDTEIQITSRQLKKIALVYGGAIRHTIDIYDKLIAGKNIDFEMSVDETLSATSPEAHYFVANELLKAGVEIVSLAPRFCGEFQKGVDYIGDTVVFEKEFLLHAKIAKKLGYKLSIHSGSDKFSVFPIVYKETACNIHIKTAGTNWLEALRVIARYEPLLFRRILEFALVNLSEAKKYYVITENTANIPVDASDADLPSLLDNNDARQVLHVTYGLVLSAKASGGVSYKELIYAALNKYEEEYCAALEKHIGRHLPNQNK